MTRIQHLEEQAARAERLAARITDALTIEKLLSFAADRRREVNAISAGAAMTRMGGRISNA
ncbi:MAG: hypothetical protein HY852_00930 [Bradyrhizobium sp.]|uniref:hypothetical protein n=1 Tax=Bradyrhizobium sp. TaxID=376 RepID=UPI0025C5A9C8|nr:hypothetical protein [Bradyrhizobium sp.]MBI5260364.1 hypothetical protein [Bradyrhizobium sp.]